MLSNTFIHIPGIGGKTERQLWAAGVLQWDDFVEPLPARIPRQKVNLIRDHLERSRAVLAERPGMFSDLLAPAEQWRLFPHFRERAAYLDIETTGLDWDESAITTIALYDGTAVYHYVQGENLEDFADDITRYAMVVTYNGKCFDVPMLERQLRIRMDQVHIDLRYVLRSLGYSGGLKGCERQLGLSRGGLDGVDGFFAVLLWQEFERTGNRRALETLLAYNIMDTVNLETLMVQAYNLKIAATPFALSHRLPLPEPPAVPFIPDEQLIGRLKSAMLY